LMPSLVAAPLPPALVTRRKELPDVSPPTTTRSVGDASPPSVVLRLNGYCAKESHERHTIHNNNLEA
jgi:hypothetical protein